MSSHPTWVRGLKLDTLISASKSEVAPYVGAWIETIKFQSLLLVLSSHPTWVRGLKLFKGVRQHGIFTSHPTWVRGLKQ